LAVSFLAFGMASVKLFVLSGAGLVGIASLDVIALVKAFQIANYSIAGFVTHSNPSFATSGPSSDAAIFLQSSH
jgi:hypothetical protein